MTHEHGATAADIETLELDGEVLADYWDAVHRLVRAAAAPPIRRVVDLGAGTGNGALGFATSFPEAEIIAVDQDAAMLARITERSAGRVRTELVDLDHDFPPVAKVDVVWASLSLHHVAEPDAVLAHIRTALRPGGLLAIAEMDEPLRFLADGPSADLEHRCLSAARAHLADELPHLGADWPALLAQTGFGEVVRHDLAIDVPCSDAVERYGRLNLDRLRTHAADRLDPADRSALDDLLGSDLGAARVRGERALFLARP